MKLLVALVLSLCVLGTEGSRRYAMKNPVPRHVREAELAARQVASGGGTVELDTEDIKYGLVDECNRLNFPSANDSYLAQSPCTGPLPTQCFMMMINRGFGNLKLGEAIDFCAGQSKPTRIRCIGSAMFPLTDPDMHNPKPYGLPIRKAVDLCSEAESLAPAHCYSWIQDGVLQTIQQSIDQCRPAKTAEVGRCTFEGVFHIRESVPDSIQLCKAASGREVIGLMQPVSQMIEFMNKFFVRFSSIPLEDQPYTVGECSREYGTCVPMEFGFTTGSTTAAARSAAATAPVTVSTSRSFTESLYEAQQREAREAMEKRMVEGEELEAGMLFQAAGAVHEEDKRARAQPRAYFQTHLKTSDYTDANNRRIVLNGLVRRFGDVKAEILTKLSELRENIQASSWWSNASASQTDDVTSAYSWKMRGSAFEAELDASDVTKTLWVLIGALKFGSEQFIDDLHAFTEWESGTRVPSRSQAYRDGLLSRAESFNKALSSHIKEYYRLELLKKIEFFERRASEYEDILIEHVKKTYTDMANQVAVERAIRNTKINSLVHSWIFAPSGGPTRPQIEAALRNAFKMMTIIENNAKPGSMSSGKAEPVTIKVDMPDWWYRTPVVPGDERQKEYLRTYKRKPFKDASDA